MRRLEVKSYISKLECIMASQGNTLIRRKDLPVPNHMSWIDTVDCTAIPLTNHRRTNYRLSHRILAICILSLNAGLRSA